MKRLSALFTRPRVPGEGEHHQDSRLRLIRRELVEAVLSAPKAYIAWDRYWEKPGFYHIRLGEMDMRP